TITAESTAVSVRYVSSEKSSWPGVSSRLNTRPSNSNVITEVTTEMPRSRSIFIQSERVLRRSPLALTCPARLIAPPNSSSFSVSVVLPASGCEMIAKVRRRATSAAIGERDGDSVAIASSDMTRAFGRETGPDQGGSAPPHIRICAPKLQLAGVFDYRSSNTAQYASAATPAEAGRGITQETRTDSPSC